MSETTAETPATDPPGDKIFVCPACGLRYDAPTTCANGHPPTETIEYDRATFEAAAAGDAEAAAAIDAAAVAAGTTAGVAAAEATPDPSTALSDQVIPPAPAGDNPAGDPFPTGTPPGGATDVPEPAAEPTEPTDPAAAEPVAPGAGVELPAAEPAAPEAPAVAEPAPAVACEVTVTVNGVTYSGTISAA